MPLNIEKIRKLIGARTIADTAKSAGMTQPGLSRILRAKFDPKLSTIERIAEALGCRAKDLLR